MKFAFLAALVVLAACATPQSSRPSGSRSTGAPATAETRSPTTAGTSESRSAPNTVSQDAAECERQAALSGSAGSRAQIFNDCMKARGRVPGR